MDTYFVQYLIEPQGDTVAVSDWREYSRQVKISPKRFDVKQAIIEKLLKVISMPIVILDYWQT